MNAESCSNCRFSIEQWRHEDVDENDAEEWGYVGPGPSIDERNLFYCRRHPPILNLSIYTVKFVEPNQVTAFSDNRGLEIYNDAPKLGIFPLSRPDYWCGEWSSR
jgi:hypothetical protein